MEEWKRLGSESQLCLRAQSLQLCLTLCNPIDPSPPDSSVHGIFPARILVWVAMPSLRGSSKPRDRTRASYVSCTAGRFFTAEPPGNSQLYSPMQIMWVLSWSICEMKNLNPRTPHTIHGDNVAGYLCPVYQSWFKNCFINSNLIIAGWVRAMQATIIVTAQSLSLVHLFAIPWTAVYSASLSFSISQSLLTFMFIESV